MPIEDLASAGLHALGLEKPAEIRSLNGFSGAGVFTFTIDGRDVVLKATPARNDADRELTFYRDLADEMPVRSPTVLDSTSTDGLVVLLFPWMRPGPPAREWTHATWLEIARQLGSLHSTLNADGLAARPWLGRDGNGPDPAARAALWAELPAKRTAIPLLAELRSLDRAVEIPPLCLIHGDCHAENFLIADDGALVWVDWQAVGAGHGPEDLALLWQRAEFNGAEVPREAALTAYAQARGIPVDDGLRRAVTAAEIRLLLMGWPSFLLQDPDQPRERLFDRLAELDRTWQMSKAG